MVIFDLLPEHLDDDFPFDGFTLVDCESAVILKENLVFGNAQHVPFEGTAN